MDVSMITWSMGKRQNTSVRNPTITLLAAYVGEKLAAFWRTQWNHWLTTLDYQNVAKRQTGRLWCET